MSRWYTNKEDKGCPSLLWKKTLTKSNLETKGTIWLSLPDQSSTPRNSEKKLKQELEIETMEEWMNTACWLVFLGHSLVQAQAQALLAFLYIPGSPA